MTNEPRAMGGLLAIDRRLTLAVGRRVRDWQRAAGWPVQALLFWGLVVVHTVLWTAICRFEQQPEWTWFLLGSGLGLLASYIAAGEAIARLDDGLGLTAHGLDRRWAVLRLTYLPLVMALLLFVSAGQPAVLVAMLAADALVMLVLEYLLTFRVLGPDELPLDERQMAALFGQMLASSAQTDAQGADDDRDRGDSPPASDA